MSIRRLVGLGLIAAAIAALGYDLVTVATGAGTFGFASLGELWGRLSAPNLNLVQAIVQRYLLPALWDPVLVNILLLPAWLVFVVLGLLLYWPKRSNDEKVT